MRKSKINITITKEETGYSANANVKNTFICTQGETFEELKANILEAVNLAFEDKGLIFFMNEIKLTLDLQSFFEFYKVVNAKALSARIGMNQSLLAQYISGAKKPSIAQTKRIMNGVQQIGRELAEIRFLM
jgi:predicted RNase H-like HicB family nuclease